MTTTMAPSAECKDIVGNNDSVGSKKLPDRINELQLRQIPSEVPGVLATVVVDIPPDGGYGWVCVACCFIINSCTWGVNSSYGVYLAHYLSENVYPGATPLQFALIGGLSISSSMIIGPLATLLLRKTSTRKVMVIGVVLESGSLIGASFSTKIWHLFLAQGLGFGIGIGFLFAGSVGVVSQWFAKNRSLAMGIAAAGSGIGGLIFSLSTRAIIANVSMAWAFRITGIITFIVNAICVVLIKDRNKRVNPNQRAFDLKLLRRVEFLLVLSWGFFSMLGYVVILFSLPDFAASRGFSKSQGSILGALLNLSMAFGRPLVGLASDRYGRINISGLMTLLTGISCLAIWLPAEQFGAAILFALINGAVCGTFWTTIAPICVEVVGLQDLPSALSLVWLSLVLPTTFSEPIALYLRRPDLDNQYLYSQIFSALMYIVASVSVWLLRAWKIGDNDQKMQQKAATGIPPNKVGEIFLEQKAVTATIISRWKSGEVSRWLRYGAV